MKTTKAIYAFSGDPITYGHIHIIERAANMFDELVIAIGINPAKKYLFSTEERVQLAQQALSKLKNVRVIAFRGLLVDYAFENNIPVIIRGLRNSEDFNAELMLYQVGESQKMNIETIFLPAGQDMSHISSGAAKALQLEQGFIHEYVPLNVKQKLEERVSGQYIIGITGEIGSGKSYVCSILAELGKIAGMPVHVVDIDKIGHQILESLSQPLYKELRETIATYFGENIKNEEGFVNRKSLGTIIFADPGKLKLFNEIIYKPLLLRLRRELYGKRGIILMDSALIAEAEMTYLCNNNIILVNTTKELQLIRLKEREYSNEQVIQRMDSQYSHDVKLKHIESAIEKDRYGKLYHLENSTAKNEIGINTLFDQIVKDFVGVPERV